MPVEGGKEEPVSVGGRILYLSRKVRKNLYLIREVRKNL